RYVYRTQASYRRTVREASQMLTKVLQLQTLLRFISDTVMRSTGAERIAVYLRDDAGFRCAVSQIGPGVAEFHKSGTPSAAIITPLESAQAPLLTDEIARDRSLALHSQFIEAHLALLLPVLSEERLIAVIAVGPKLSGDAFYQHDLDLLMTLANQAGVAIKN